MVANVKRQRIITGEAPVEELQRKFTEEVKGMMKNAAAEIGCSVHELMYRVNNAGVVEIQRMTAKEMVDAAANEATQKRVIQVKKDRGVFDE